MVFGGIIPNWGCFGSQRIVVKGQLPSFSLSWIVAEPGASEEALIQALWWSFACPRWHLWSELGYLSVKTSRMPTSRQHEICISGVWNLCRQNILCLLGHKGVGWIALLILFRCMQSCARAIAHLKGQACDVFCGQTLQFIVWFMPWNSIDLHKPWSDQDKSGQMVDMERLFFWAIWINTVYTHI